MRLIAASRIFGREAAIRGLNEMGVEEPTEEHIRLYLRWTRRVLLVGGIATGAAVCFVLLYVFSSSVSTRYVGLFAALAILAGLAVWGRRSGSLRIRVYREK